MSGENSGNVRTSDIGQRTSEVRSRKSEVLGLAAFLALLVFAARGADFQEGWRFRREGGEWQTVSIPHDDAIRHDFNPKK